MGDETDTNPQPPIPSPCAEKRSIRRRALTRLILAEVSVAPDRSSEIHYMHINNVSEAGMKLTSDTRFPEGTPIRIKMYLDYPVELEARVIWHREAGSGNHSIGVAFLSDSKKLEEGIQELLRLTQPLIEKRSFRYGSTVYFQTDFEDSEKNFYAHVVVISPGGMEVMNSFPFPERCIISIKFTLRQDIPPITVRARVLFQRIIHAQCDPGLLPNNHKIWLEFLEPEKVQAHLCELQGK